MSDAMNAVNEDANPAVVVRCTERPGTLTFRLANARNGPTIVATLALPGLTASQTVYLLPGGPFGLAAFFESCAQDWRGWVGAKEWPPLEREVGLTATHDRIGHITLRVRVRDYTTPEWRAEGELVLEAGGLDGLVRDVSRFEEALPSGLGT